MSSRNRVVLSTVAGGIGESLSRQTYHIAPAPGSGRARRAMGQTMPLKPSSPKPPQAIKPPRELESRDIAFAALALARRAEQAGLPIAAYLLDLAALETGADITIRRFGPIEIERDP